MIISLARVPTDGLKFEHSYVSGELNLGERDFRLIDLPVVTGRIERIGVDMRLRGTLRALVSRQCDRCLKDIEVPIDLSLDLLYTPAETGRGRSGEIELQERDLDFAIYDNDQISLDEMVVEQLELSLPSRVLCNEECQGICPQCGVDLNAEKCDCNAPIDPRWQALAAVREELENQ